ncbi:cardiolipin synthase [Saxibacter everestensis]|uniref:Cardiolipin synthase n=1 Tax=Saxibacter everestensis TaxID=2909229 RepID=A0ABY8QYG8_9MICO|nr:cardiolipin synthase [Brevibacteriaceae bacterium ZFBP1038]
MFPSVSISGIPTVVTAALIAIDIAIRVVAIGIVPRNRRPSAALGWLLAIFFIPYIGILLYLAIGSPKLPKKRREKQDYIDSVIVGNTKGMKQLGDLATLPGWVRSAAILNRRLGALPLIGGNAVELLDGYQHSLDAMTDAITRAKDYVHVEFYIFALDSTTTPFIEALESAANRGVKIRLLLDHIGSARSVGYRRTVNRLDAMNIEWYRMLPIRPWRGYYQRPDLRNHRKLLVIDGSVGFTGSQNIIDRSYNKKVNLRRGLQWKDLMVRTTGPVVDQINALFVSDWYGETNELLTDVINVLEPSDLDDGLQCQIVPSGPGFEGENNLRLFNALLYSARERVVITSPYFVPDESMLYAITTAAQRGLDVQIFMGETSDQWLVYHAQRSYYEMLLRAGVQIFLYKSPYVLHSKLVTIDDDVAVVGSSNMDMRSFSLNLEISLMVCAPEFVAEVRKIEDQYRRDSRQLHLENWVQRPLWQRYVDNLCRLTSALQ